MIEAPLAPAVRQWQPVAPVPEPADTGGALVYAVGDVHGRYDLLVEALAVVQADAADRAGGRVARLVLLGDYVDRGPGTAEVLQALVWLRRHGPFELHALKGNHEQMLLDFLAEPARGRSWYNHGGDATLRSYELDVPAEPPGPAELAGLRDALMAAMPAAHLAFVQRLEMKVEAGGYAFVHAGVRPGVPLAEQADEDLLWIRREFLDHEGGLGSLVVHGHSWKGDQPQFRANRIGLDTGAYATDRLTLLRLDGTAAAWCQVGGG